MTDGREILFYNGAQIIKLSESWLPFQVYKEYQSGFDFDAIYVDLNLTINLIQGG